MSENGWCEKTALDSGQDEGKIDLGMFVSERCSDGDMVVGRIVDSMDNKSLR